MIRSRFPAVLCLLLLLSACVSFTLVKGGKKLDLGEGVSVQPTHDWNRVKIDKFEYWTLDGLRLQNILFIKGVEDGERIAPSSLGARSEPEKDTFPKFRKGMTFLEIRELFEATLARQKAQRVVISDFTPGPFAGRDGFRFAFTYVTSDGLQMLGTASGAILKDKLYMVVYTGTKLHFFDRGKRDFDHILASFTIK